MQGLLFLKEVIRNQAKSKDFIDVEINEPFTKSGGLVDVVISDSPLSKGPASVL